MNNSIYDPKEDLKRIKLLMRYDTKKTLTENEEKKELITEGPALIFWAAAAAVPLVAGWIDSVRGGGDSFKNTEMFFKGCNTNLSVAKPVLPQQKHRDAADIIYNNSVGESWYQGFGSGNEEAIKGALESMQTPSDLCALKNEFQASYSRDLFDALDSEIDGEDFTKYVWLPIKRMLEKAAEAIDQAQSSSAATTNDNGTTGGETPGGGSVAPVPTSKWKSCDKEYTQNCKSEKIKEVQSCLGGLVADGKFGPKTQAALEKAGFPNGFKDEDIQKICKKQNEPEDDEFSVDVDSETEGDKIEDLINL